MTRQSHPEEELPSAVEQLFQIWRRSDAALPPSPGPAPRSTRRPIGAAAADTTDERWQEWSSQLLQRIHTSDARNDEDWPLLAPLPRAHDEPVWASSGESAGEALSEDLPDSTSFQELARAALAARDERFLSAPAQESPAPASELTSEAQSVERLRPPAPSAGAPAAPPAAAAPPAPTASRRVESRVTDLGSRAPQNPTALKRPPPPPPAAAAASSNLRQGPFTRWWALAALAASVLAVWIMRPSPAERALAPLPSAAPRAAAPAEPELVAPSPAAPPKHEPPEASVSPSAEEPPTPQAAARPVTPLAPTTTAKPLARLTPRSSAARSNPPQERPRASGSARRSVHAPTGSVAASTAAAVPPAPALVPAARERADSTSLPARPTIGAAQNAIGAVLGAARTCVAGQSAPSRSTVVFDSSGRVREVHISGSAAGTSAETCLKRALSQARVRPFSDPSFSVRTAVRP